MKNVKNRLYRFDEVEIDVQNLRVMVGSEIRPLEPKSFRLLLFLAENPGRVLAKDEIMAAVWADSFVSDNSLARAITQIRKAIDDDPTSPRYIETVPSVGYRFVADGREETREKLGVRQRGACRRRGATFFRDQPVAHRGHFGGNRGRGDWVRLSSLAQG